jgi:hypothetical protein
MNDEENSGLAGMLSAYEQKVFELATAQLRLHAVVQAIGKRYGKGPFLWAGKEISLAKRRGKMGYTVRVRKQKAQEV